uniref:(northern house mosquito) hypothetical protein n=1 Tax=Culex pipiens TaxID=7175 RepID=A0A8D8BTP5_CULPI
MWTSAVASSTPAPKHSRNEISDGKRSRLRWAQNSGRIPAKKLPNPSARMANSLASFLLMLVSGSSRMLVTLTNGPCCWSVRSIVRFEIAIFEMVAGRLNSCCDEPDTVRALSFVCAAFAGWFSVTWPLIRTANWKLSHCGLINIRKILQLDTSHTLKTASHCYTKITPRYTTMLHHKRVEQLIFESFSFSRDSPAKSENATGSDEHGLKAALAAHRHD